MSESADHLTVEDIAEELAVSVATVRRYLRQDGIDPVEHVVRESGGGMPKPLYAPSCLDTLRARAMKSRQSRRRQAAKASGAPVLSVSEIRERLRAGLADAATELIRLTREAQREKDRIAAIKIAFDFAVPKPAPEQQQGAEQSNVFAAFAAALTGARVTTPTNKEHNDND